MKRYREKTKSSSQRPGFGNNWWMNFGNINIPLYSYVNGMLVMVINTEVLITVVRECTLNCFAIERIALEHGDKMNESFQLASSSDQVLPFSEFTWT